MKKIFIVLMDAYDDFGVHTGSEIIGAYTTFELAKAQINDLNFNELDSLEYEYTIQTVLLEGE
jgi:hypothetical protein